MATKKKATAKPTKTLEQTLWDAADKLRGNLEASEYKHVVLGLVFLKYVSDAFTERRKFLEAATADPKNSEYYVPKADRRDSIIEDRNEYTSNNVFWVPMNARWDYLQDRAKQPEIGVLIDAAMDLIEKENPTLKGVLPKQFARAEIDKLPKRRDRVGLRQVRTPRWVVVTIVRLAWSGDICQRAARVCGSIGMIRRERMWPFKLASKLFGLVSKLEIRIFEVKMSAKLSLSVTSARSVVKEESELIVNELTCPLTAWQETTWPE